MINDLGGQFYLPVQICVDHLHSRQKQGTEPEKRRCHTQHRFLSVFFMSVRKHASKKGSNELWGYLKRLCDALQVETFSRPEFMKLNDFISEFTILQCPPFLRAWPWFRCCSWPHLRQGPLTSKWPFPASNRLWKGKMIYLQSLWRHNFFNASKALSRL